MEEDTLLHDLVQDFFSRISRYSKDIKRLAEPMMCMMHEYVRMYMYLVLVFLFVIIALLILNIVFTVRMFHHVLALGVRVSAPVVEY